MDDMHPTRVVYGRREFNTRGSRSMMDLNDVQGSRPPPKRPDNKINYRKKDNRQRNDHTPHPRNNYQHPHEVPDPRFRHDQHERFPHDYHQGHPERYGPHNPHFDPTNNHHFNSGPWNPHPANHFNSGPWNPRPANHFNSGPWNPRPANHFNSGPWNPRPANHFNSGPVYPHPPNHPRDARDAPTHHHPRVYERDRGDSRQHPSGYPNRSGRAYDSYEESDQGYPKDIIDILVKELSYKNTLYDTVHNIVRNISVPPRVVLTTAESRKDIFTINENYQNKILRLDPKLVLCLKHYSANGCSSSNCTDLHICRNHIHGRCKSKEPCFHGHGVKTNHNNTTFYNLHVSCLSDECLLRVIRNSCKFVDYLEVCHHYNTENGCKYTRCRKLHICRKFVTDINSCTRCRLNHDVLDKQCLGLLEFHGVPTNETPRDILKQIRSLSELQTTSTKESTDQMKQKKPDPKINAKTYKSTDIYGDVKITEICVHSIEQNCQDYQNGCKYLHSKNPFHWQVSSNGRWYNIPIFQTKALEDAFCQVSKSSGAMSGLGKSCTQELIEVLGTDPWEADFISMKLRNTKNDKELTIRRLSTPSSLVKDTQNATVFQWYFKDEQDKWIKYGDADSLNRKDMTSSITSNDIEEQFLKRPKSPVSFSNSQYQYTIDFSKMVQVNETTKKVREVRRRPTHPVKNAGGDEEEKKKKPGQKPDQETRSRNVPSHWKKMDHGSIHALVPLDSSSDEYREVADRLFITMPTANIQSIQRLQNPYLWDSFQSRKEYLTQRDCKDHLHVNKLFYGMDEQELDTICLGNIDWRRQGTSDMNYGQGTYFSNSAAVALQNSTENASGHKYMILATVIIGEIVKGDPSWTRPPLDASRNVPYDTAVDNMAAPTFFVKFESNEYYPCHVIQLRTST
ncbi:protein mono-ADP-ribosyltransferase PARP12-like [Macrobrachium nipponense]|uniref:protein mono-ADP-ribosyltransferase PARP12-like n=1 Tax=Macrobrachium nipponense TaxID=159736 RepID=UPI0030C870DD